MSWTDTQTRLVSTLVEYQGAERLAALFPATLALGVQADRMHDALLKAALVCGFEPGGRHSHMTTLAWSIQRAEAIRLTFPLHLREAAQDNQQRAA